MFSRGERTHLVASRFSCARGEVARTITRSSEEMPLAFVHLSDIHFGTDDNGGPDDRNDDLRRELERDAVIQCADLQPIAGVLVSGDIAAQGRKVEYEYAQSFLDRLCERLKIGSHRVWMVPGNHDIDRSVQPQALAARMAREKLRHDPIETIDDLLRDAHADTAVRDQLYAPLANYNAFALAYDSICDGHEQRWWIHEFELAEDLAVRIRGVNSALISDSSDCRENGQRLVVGTGALTIPNDEHVVSILMCHHPPTWLRDQDVIDGPVACRARMQLFGHEHRQRVINYDGTIRVFAGALHPKRDPSWRPQYNIIVLRVDGAPTARRLLISVIARVWSRQRAMWVEDEGAPGGRHEFAFDLPPRMESESVAIPPETARAHGAPIIAARTTVETVESEVVVVPNFISDQDRRLSHLFFRLHVPQQWEVARALGLEGVTDAPSSSLAFFAEVFRKAREANRLNDLRTLIESKFAAPSGADE